jgi:hypothetical protein
MKRTLARLFTLKPYGNQLMDGMAETWLIFAALNILSIAFCDALAWGYFAYTTSYGALAYVAAVIAGLIVLVLVGSLDAMFIMHDRSQRHDRRDTLAIGARIVLVILTFTVTAPFLTQLFFARDIEANIKRRNERTVATRRAEIAAGFDARMDSNRAALAARQSDLEKEIAGSGASGRYGKGPTAAAIERGIGDLQIDIAATDNAKNVELRTFDEAVATPELLANKYGIDLTREGPATRARVIEELETSPAFRSTQRTIKAFLVFMFLGLVCLKLFQPESVRIYFSAKLQAAYARMQAGVFNHRLDAREHPGAVVMTPIRFADWYENDQHVRDATDRLRDQTASAIERLKAQEDAVRVLHETLRLDIVRMQEDLATTAATNDDLERQSAEAQHELAVLNAKITEEQQALDDFRYDQAEDLPLRDQQLLISSRNRTVRNLADHRAATAALTATLQRLTHRLETGRAYENGLRTSVAAAGTEVTSLTGALQEARQKRLADILALT